MCVFLMRRSVNKKTKKKKKTIGLWYYYENVNKVHTFTARCHVIPFPDCNGLTCLLLLLC